MTSLVCHKADRDASLNSKTPTTQTRHEHVHTRVLGSNRLWLVRVCFITIFSKQIKKQ